MSEDSNVEAAVPVPCRGPWVRNLVFGIVILVCGAVIGSVTTAVAVEKWPSRGPHRRERIPESIAESMQRRYSLTDDQTCQVLEAFREHARRLSEVRAEVQPRLEAEHQALRQKMEGILTAEQAQEWRKEDDARWSRWRSRPGESRNADVRPKSDTGGRSEDEAAGARQGAQ